MGVRAEDPPVMATTESTVGMDHLTVVPENFGESDARDDETGGRDRNDR